jgi:hypothetical protein
MKALLAPEPNRQAPFLFRDPDAHVCGMTPAA